MGIAQIRASMPAAIAVACPLITTTYPYPPLKRPVVTDLPVVFVEQVQTAITGANGGTFVEGGGAHTVTVIVLMSVTSSDPDEDQKADAMADQLLGWMVDSPYTGTLLSTARYAVDTLEYRAIVMQVVLDIWQ